MLAYSGVENPMSTMILFEANGNRIPANEKSLVLQCDKARVSFRGLGIHLAANYYSTARVSLTVEETVDLESGELFIVGAKVSGCRSGTVSWDLAKDKTALSSMVCEVAQGIVDRTISGETRGRLAYSIFWQSMKRDKHLRNWVAKHFPEWYRLAFESEREVKSSD